MSEIEENPFLLDPLNRSLTAEMMNLIENSSSHEEEMASVTALRKILLERSFYQDRKTTEGKLYLAFIAAKEILEETEIVTASIKPEDFSE